MSTNLVPRVRLVTLICLLALPALAQQHREHPLPARTNLPTSRPLPYNIERLAFIGPPAEVCTYAEWEDLDPSKTYLLETDHRLHFITGVTQYTIILTKSRFTYCRSFSLRALPYDTAPNHR